MNANVKATPLTLTSPQFRLQLEPGPRELHCRLEHLPSHTVLADAPYSYSFGTPAFDSIRRDASALVLVGKTDTGIEVQQRFTLEAGSGWLEEQITLRNLRSSPLDLHDVRCGMLLPANSQLAAQSFTAVPFTREPNDTCPKQYATFPAAQILSDEFSSGLWVRYSVTPTGLSVTPRFAAEGWIWRHESQTFLVTKYSQEGMEWSLLDRVPLPQDSTALRWAGIGLHHSQPESGARLLPGESHRFGITRVTPVRSDGNHAHYAFRDEMAARGHGCPPGFDPPIHWNELYDNKLLFLGDEQYDDPEMRKQYYTLADMKAEAAKAKAIGCDALYLDPGWDTNFASKIWDEARLGPFAEFVSMLAGEFGLKCSLHTPLSGWCNPTTHPPESYRLNRFGERARWKPGPYRHFRPPICGASNQYLAETATRLSKLAREGAAYFMFDGTMYHAECWDPAHGHRVPARIEEHVNATAQLARMVHEEFPEVLIEMHDPVVGPTYSRYAPIYYGHGRAGFDSVWAFEQMMFQLEYIRNGQALALYYYNLAYALPLYLHIDLRKDNANALAFWWNASTCRHLGIGGTPEDPAVRAAHREAMSTYRRLKPYFCSGEFYGIDESTHAHSQPDGSSAVVNCFNMTDAPIERNISIEPAEIGLDARVDYQFTGALARRVGAGYIVSVRIQAQGHTLIEITGPLKRGDGPG